MTRYLLDTNILSDLVRNPQGNVAAHLGTIAASQICTSFIVSAELPYGAAKRGSKRLTAQLEAILGHIEILPFESPTDSTYALLRTRLEKSGKLIGANDLFIAAQALALDCVVVTDNQREFARVPDLRCENWLR